jgi:GNAT superfamily N-acetyltransferase
VSAPYERVEAEAYGQANERSGLPTLRIAGGICCAIPGLDSPMLNRATALGVEREPTDTELDEIEAFFGAAGVRYYVSVPPAARGELEPRLRERGFTDGYAWMKFSRGVDPVPARETPLSVEQTRDEATFSRILASAFDLAPDTPINWGAVADLPGWSLFLACDGGEPVATAALLVQEGVGWLGAAGTLAEQRGKGAQAALIAARIERARELGADTVVTETGEQLPDRQNKSYRNILRAGFAEAYLRPNLLSPQ